MVEKKTVNYKDYEAELNRIKALVDVTNEEESAGTWLIVADWESFSIYAIVTVSQWTPDSVQVIHDLNWGYWVENGDTTSIFFAVPS